MDDRADEIARTLALVYLGGDLDGTVSRTIAAALRSYGREMADAQLEHAARWLNTSGTTTPITSLRAAAVFVQSLKSKPEAQDTQT